MPAALLHNWLEHTIMKRTRSDILQRLTAPILRDLQTATALNMIATHYVGRPGCFALIQIALFSIAIFFKPRQVGTDLIQEESLLMLLKRLTKLILEAIGGEFGGDALKAGLIHHLHDFERLVWQMAVLDLLFTRQRQLLTTLLLLMILKFRGHPILSIKCHHSIAALIIVRNLKKCRFNLVLLQLLVLVIWWRVLVGS